MKLLGPTRFHRLNEALAVVFLFVGVSFTLSLISYHSSDPSWNTATTAGPVKNLLGIVGAHISDLLLQTFGLGAFAFPALILLLAWKWLRSQALEAPFAKIIGAVMLLAALAAAFSQAPSLLPSGGTFAAGGIFGLLLAEFLTASLNPTGAALLTATILIVSLYLVSRFSMATLAGWFSGPIGFWKDWSSHRRARREERRRRKMELAAAAAAEKALMAEPEPKKSRGRKPREEVQAPVVVEELPPWEESVHANGNGAINGNGYPKGREVVFEEPEFAEPAEEEIPIHVLEEAPPAEPAPVPAPAPAPEPPREEIQRLPEASVREHPEYVLPSSTLLNEPSGKLPYDEIELKETAARIKSKFQEFNVLGSVSQINPGPVVTTFEFKPEAGIKYSRITTLSEDLCLGLQAESILIERIPGKPTVGIEVPNTRREVISLRQILESDEFRASPSRLTIALGKDISGRIKVASLESMPHLLIAGSTGSGKSVMLNSLIMSVLFKSTPDEVRMILVDPKRVEMGIYEGIPHLLTPVVTDAKKATNALRNAVLEMERRLKLLASQGVRNIEQFNKKVRRLRDQPRSLFMEDEEPDFDELQTLPYILIVIDELADLMMLERANVEETVTRLAQMARAVGMHLVLATQRPSVDVITGLIKANFPARISFRVATRVDSRTILDVMGSEHLLGKGDMLFLPPGSSRLVRVHGAFVTESEIVDVVDFWKSQARPDYDQTFLMAPPTDDEDGGEEEELDGREDPLYQDAVRVVVELGKASTSTLQRRLRLGYGRAARILDMMQKDGIIGPPDGSRPRDVLKRPDWLTEVEYR